MSFVLIASPCTHLAPPLSQVASKLMRFAQRAWRESGWSAPGAPLEVRHSWGCGGVSYTFCGGAHVSSVVTLV